MALVRRIQEKHNRSIGKLFVQFLRDFEQVLTEERAREVMYWIVALSVEENRKLTFLDAFKAGGRQESMRDLEWIRLGWAEVITKDGETFFAEHEGVVPEMEEPSLLIEDDIPDFCMIRLDGNSEEETIKSFVDPLFRFIWRRLGEVDREGFLKILKGKRFYLYREKDIPADHEIENKIKAVEEKIKNLEENLSSDERLDEIENKIKALKEEALSIKGRFFSFRNRKELHLQRSSLKETKNNESDTTN